MKSTAKEKLFPLKLNLLKVVFECIKLVPETNASAKFLHSWLRRKKHKTATAISAPIPPRWRLPILRHLTTCGEGKSMDSLKQRKC